MLMEKVVVAPAIQGLGLGRRLLEFAERAAHGYRYMRLHTNKARTENIALYSKLRNTPGRGDGAAADFT
jgi:ribosomal protein S18 acetylase RimI-like enzyme